MKKTLMHFFIKSETFDLGHDLVNNFSAWKQNMFDISNDNKAIHTANGITFIDFSPNISAFNIIEKIYLHRCIKKCNVLNALNYKKVEE